MQRPWAALGRGLVAPGPRGHPAGSRSGTRRFAALSTMGSRQSYGNLVLTTRRDNREHRNILTNVQAALLVDNRGNWESDTTGETRSNRGSELVESCLERNPSLTGSLEGRGTAVIVVSATDHVVARFNGAERIAVGDAS